MTWDPKEWEEWVNALLSARYGPRYQRIPAHDQGDFGLEGFATDGTAYQSYAPQDDDEGPDLYAKQQSKVYRDTDKLRRYDDGLARTLCGLQISIWTLVVPTFETKRLLEYAGSRTAEVRKWNLRCASADFRIHVNTEADYAAERRKLLDPSDISTRLRRVTTPPDATPPKPELIRVMGDKLRALGLTEARHQAMIDTLVAQFMLGQEMLELLRRRFPDRHETLQAVKRTKQAALALDVMPEDVHVKLMFRSLRGSLTTTFAEVGNVKSDVAEQFADEAIADWLMRCPLEF